MHVKDLRRCTIARIHEILPRNFSEIPKFLESFWKLFWDPKIPRKSLEVLGSFAFGRCTMAVLQMHASLMHVKDPWKMHDGYPSNACISNAR
jgi:hypothetical protein